MQNPTRRVWLPIPLFTTQKAGRTEASARASASHSDFLSLKIRTIRVWLPIPWFTTRRQDGPKYQPYASTSDSSPTVANLATRVQHAAPSFTTKRQAKPRHQHTLQPLTKRRKSSNTSTAAHTVLYHPEAGQTEVSHTHQLLTIGEPKTPTRPQNLSQKRSGRVVTPVSSSAHVLERGVDTIRVVSGLRPL